MNCKKLVKNNEKYTNQLSLITNTTGKIIK